MEVKQAGWWAMMLIRDDLWEIDIWEEVALSKFIGRWVSRDASCALVAFEGRDVVGLLFGAGVGGQYRPVEARFIPEASFPARRDAVQDLLEEWVRLNGANPPALSTTGLRELPMGQMVARLTERVEDRPPVDVPRILTPEVEHAATNNPQGHGFRNTRELRSRVEQLRASYYYVTALAMGEQAPLDYVATEMDLKESSARARAGTLIQYSRRNGYLSDSGGAGRAGGQLTDLAIEHVRRIAQAGAHHV